MNPTATLILGLFMRWLHITCVVVLIGSAFYAWRTSRSYAPVFAPVAYTAMAGIVISGLYNFLTKSSYPPGYHMWFGIKMLLVLHVLAAFVLVVRRSAAGASGQARSLAGIIISGAIIIVISAYLRSMSLALVVP